MLLLLLSIEKMREMQACTAAVCRQSRQSLAPPPQTRPRHCECQYARPRSAASTDARCDRNHAKRLKGRHFDWQQEARSSFQPRCGRCGQRRNAPISRTASYRRFVNVHRLCDTQVSQMPHKCATIRRRVSVRPTAALRFARLLISSRSDTHVLRSKSSRAEELFDLPIQLPKSS